MYGLKNVALLVAHEPRVDRMMTLQRVDDVLFTAADKDNRQMNGSVHYDNICQMMLVAHLSAAAATTD